MSKKNRNKGPAKTESERAQQMEADHAAGQAQAVKTEAVVTDAGTPKAKVAPGVCRVKHGAKLRGARDAWYQRLLAYDGKPVAEYEASCKAEPPSTPTKGALAGKGEPPSGWVSWFKREGLLTVEAPQAAEQTEQATA